MTESIQIIGCTGGVIPEVQAASRAAAAHSRSAGRVGVVKGLNMAELRVPTQVGPASCRRGSRGGNGRHTQAVPERLHQIAMREHCPEPAQ